MPRIIPALGTDHDVRLFGEDVNDLAFAFIAPLGAYQNRVSHNDLELGKQKIPEV